MKIEYFAIVALIIVIIIIIIISQNKKKRLREQLSQHKIAANAFKIQCQSEYSDLKNQFNKEIEDYKNEYLELKRQSEKELEDYKKEVTKNFQEKIPYGEQQLLKVFRELLPTDTFKDFTVYTHLSYENGYGFKEVDFFIVSPKGLFVIESKRWNGVTYIYDEGYQDIFNGTMFDKFAVGSNKGVRVFNARESEDKKDAIILSAYTHPLSQARGYSRDLKQTFGTKISNIIVFSTPSWGNILCNDKPLSHVKIDDYSDIMIEEKLKDFFTARPNCLSQEEMDNANQKIQSSASLKWQFKIDKSNCNEGPFNLIDQ